MSILDKIDGYLNEARVNDKQLRKSLNWFNQLQLDGEDEQEIDMALDDIIHDVDDMLEPLDNDPNIGNTVMDDLYKPFGIASHSLRSDIWDPGKWKKFKAELKKLLQAVKKL
jgi:hypothetical protein